jgi:hypothetical protein
MEIEIKITFTCHSIKYFWENWNSKYSHQHHKNYPPSIPSLTTAECNNEHLSNLSAHISARLGSA